MREPFADAIINIILPLSSLSLLFSFLFFSLFLLFREVRHLLVIFVDVEGTTWVKVKLRDWKSEQQRWQGFMWVHVTPAERKTLRKIAKRKGKSERYATKVRVLRQSKETGQNPPPPSGSSSGASSFFFTLHFLHFHTFSSLLSSPLSFSFMPSPSVSLLLPLVSPLLLWLDFRQLCMNFSVTTTSHIKGKVRTAFPVILLTKTFFATFVSRREKESLESFFRFYPKPTHSSEYYFIASLSHDDAQVILRSLSSFCLWSFGQWLFCSLFIMHRVILVCKTNINLNRLLSSL